MLFRSNPRQHDRAVRVELTAVSKGPVIRAEAAAQDKMGALDLAVDKMAAQMRRAADRRRIHRGRHAPVSVQLPPAHVAYLSGHCYLMQDDLQKAYTAYQQALYLLPNPKVSSHPRHRSRALGTCSSHRT